jgi:transcriptional regulator with XRE-family HTH domain
MTPDTGVLVQLARVALGETNHGLAERLGSSRRTGQRWVSGSSLPSTEQLRKLAGFVYPVDARLASQIAEATGTTVQELGVVPPPPPAVPPKEAIADSVVCAAADAMQRLPSDLRPALLAAFSRAAVLGLGVDDVVQALRAQLAPPPPAQSRETAKAQKKT